MAEELSDKQREEIMALDHYGLAKLWRHAPSGHPLMSGPAGDLVKQRLFHEHDGFTPEISKRVGW